VAHRTAMMSAIFYGVIGSILAVFVIAVASRTGIAVRLFGSRYRLAKALRAAGITKFHLSRDDYKGTLRTYLSNAKHSIGIVSISLQQKHEEGDLIDFFRNRLAQELNFRVRISLLAPYSEAAVIAAESLNVPHKHLAREITEMLQGLDQLRTSLPPIQRQRLELFVHECLPMGSAILLDATPEKGVIQVETKLHRAPRDESFSFEILGPSSFYYRHYRAWMDVFDQSRPPTAEELRAV
jgi:hypothetical protein